MALPQIGAAFDAGDIPYTMAELLARHATPETEGELLAAARRSTVRTMRRALEKAKQAAEQARREAAGAKGEAPRDDEDGEEDEGPAMSTLERRVL